MNYRKPRGGERSKSVKTRIIRFIQVILFRIWSLFARFPRFELLLLELLNARFLIGVLGVVLDDEGRMLILEHTYKPFEPWALPGGWLKRDEPVDRMLERELMEETNFRIKVGPCIAARNCPTRRQVEVYYLCRYISGEFTPSPEISDFRFVDLISPPEEMQPYQRVWLQEIMPRIDAIRADMAWPGSDASSVQE